MSDPASLIVSVDLDGLDPTELAAVVALIPAGAEWFGETTQPPLGGVRHEIRITDLSIQGAAELTAGVRQYVAAKASGGASNE